MQQNSQFEISKVYDIWLQRYRNYEVRVCDKESIPFCLRLKISKCSVFNANIFIEHKKTLKTLTKSYKSYQILSNLIKSY